MSADSLNELSKAFPDVKLGLLQDILNWCRRHHSAPDTGLIEKLEAASYSNYPVSYKELKLDTAIAIVRAFMGDAKPDVDRMPAGSIPAVLPSPSDAPAHIDEGTLADEMDAVERDEAEFNRGYAVGWDRATESIKADAPARQPVDVHAIARDAAMRRAVHGLPEEGCASEIRVNEQIKQQRDELAERLEGLQNWLALGIQDGFVDESAAAQIELIDNLFRRLNSAPPATSAASKGEV